MRTLRKIIGWCILISIISFSIGVIFTALDRLTGIHGEPSFWVNIVMGYIATGVFALGIWLLEKAHELIDD